MARTRREVGASPIGAVMTVRPSFKHGHPVGDRLNLRHSMRDVDEGDALGAETLDQVEKARGFGALERRRRLVHHQDARVDRKRLGDLDHLLLGDREAPRFSVRRGR